MDYWAEFLVESKTSSFCRWSNGMPLEMRPLRAPEFSPRHPSLDSFPVFWDALHMRHATAQPRAD